MGVGLAFLRPQEDGSWEGDYELCGWGGFGDLQEALLSHRAPSFIYFREDEFDFEDLLEGPPPHPATVSESLARDLIWWIDNERPKVLKVIRSLSDDDLESSTQFVKRLVESHLEQGYAVLVSP